MAKKTEQTEPTAKQQQPPEAGDGKDDSATVAGHVCDVAFCPIGLALSAVQPIKPDIVEHLLVAGREFFLAAKAIMDARADDLSRDGTSSSFEKIDIG